MKYSPWLLRKKEREIFHKCVDISKHILDHARYLERGVRYFLAEDFSNCVKECSNVSEKEITRLRKDLTFELGGHYIALESREDLSRIIFGFEEISSYIGSTAFRLSMKELTLDSYLKEKMWEMTSSVVLMLEELHITLKLLNQDLEAVLEKTYNITLMEENVDVVRRNMLKHLVNDSIADPIKLFVVAEILNSLESIADSANMVANVLELVVVRHLP